MELKEAIEKILTGNSILFTGSGFSNGAQNLLNSSPKTTKALTAYLYHECGIEENDNNLKSASDFYIETFGEFKLIELLKQEYTITKITDEQEYIASMPWKRIYTTNYDNVFELASLKQKKNVTPIVLQERVDHYKDKRTLCIHLNGYIDRLTPPALHKEFKLTDTSYLTSEFVSSSWVDLFRNDFESSSVILFIGFSLNEDLDLARIISTLSKRKNVFFIVKPGESILSIRKLSRYGQVLSIGLEGMVNEIKNIRNSFIPPEVVQLNLKSFDKVIKDLPVPITKDINIIDLFFKGNVDHSLIHYSQVDPNKYMYYLIRKELSELMEYINSGGTNILIHSDLGNGKTLLINGLTDCLANQGYEVYCFKKYYDQTNTEIEQLCLLNQKVVLVFENYSAHFDLLKKLSLFRTKDTVVIVSERSIINDTVFYTLEETIFTGPYISKDLNRISNEEASKITEIISHYGFWGKYTKLSFERKMNIINKNCNSSLRLILLLLLDSPDIKNRFNNLLLKIKNANKSFFDATLLILSSNIFDFHLELDDLIYILDDELLNNPAFHNNDYLLEIIDFNNYKISVRSSILAESLLVRNQFHDDLISLLIKVVKKLDSRGFDKNNYSILKSIISFTRLQMVFNLNENHSFKPLILSFFEEIKNTYYAKNNPFFWLQYAIARLSTRDYQISELYFRTAYSLAEKNPDFDTFQIDNHYARQILENEIYNGDLTTCMEQFMKAHNILANRTGPNENKHYPLRVAINYGRFYDRYFAELKDQDKIVFLLSCKEILLKVNDYKKFHDESRWNRSALTCENEIKRVLEKEKILVLSMQPQQTKH